MSPLPDDDADERDEHEDEDADGAAVPGHAGLVEVKLLVGVEAAGKLKGQRFTHEYLWFYP